MLFGGDKNYQRQKRAAPIPESSGMLSEFGKGIGSGIDQLQALGGGSIALVGSAFGSEDFLNYGMDIYNEQMSEAEENAAEIGRIEDIDGIGDALLWGSYVVGNALPSVLGAVGTGGAGGVAAKKILKDQVESRINKEAKKKLQQETRQNYIQKSLKSIKDRLPETAVGKGQLAGAVGFSVGIGAGESFARIFEEEGVESPSIAIGVGIASGALDALLPLQTLKRILPTDAYKKAATEIGDDIIKRRGVVKRMLEDGGKGFGVEGVTEVMQEIIQQGAVEWVKGQNDLELADGFFTRMVEGQNLSQYMNAFFAGGVGGGAIGGGVSALTQDIVPQRTLENQTTTQKNVEAMRQRVAEDQEETPSIDPLEEEARKRSRRMEGRAKREERRQREQLRPPVPRLEAPRAPRVQTDFTVTPEDGVFANVIGDVRLQVRRQLDDQPQVREEAERIVSEGFRVGFDPVVSGTFFGQPSGEVFEARQSDVDRVEGDPRINRGRVFEAEPLPKELESRPSLRIEDQSQQDQRDQERISSGSSQDGARGQIPQEREISEAEQRATEARLELESELTQGNLSEFTYTFEDLDAELQLPILEKAQQNNEPVQVSFTFDQVSEVIKEQPKPKQKSLFDKLKSSITNVLAESDRVPNAEIRRQVARDAGQIAPPMTIDFDVFMENEPDAAASVDSNLSSQLNDLKNTIKNVGTDVASLALQQDLNRGRYTPLGNVLDGINLTEFDTAMADLLNKGLPLSIIQSNDRRALRGFSLPFKNRVEGIDGTYHVTTKTIRLSPDKISDILDADPNVTRLNRKKFRHTLMHEMAHAYDILHLASKRLLKDGFSVGNLSFNDNAIDMDMGGLVKELHDAYLGGGILGQQMRHPFENIGQQLPKLRAFYAAGVDRTTMLANHVRMESFAQAFAAYHLTPQAMQQEAPMTFAAIRDMINQTENTNAESNNQNAQNTESGQVRGDVRAQSFRRRLGIQRAGDGREDGGDGGIQRETPDRMGREIQGEERDSAGSAIPQRQPRAFLTDPEDISDLDTRQDTDDFINEFGMDMPTLTRQEISEENQDTIANVRDQQPLKETLKSKVATKLRKWFSAGGLLPKTAFDSMIERDGQLGAVEIDIRQLLGTYNEAVGEYFNGEPQRQEDIQLLDTALKTPANDIPALGLPESISSPLISMRKYIDNMSVDYVEILQKQLNEMQGDPSKNRASAAKEMLMEAIINNIGTYANRSYRAFDDPNWFRSVPDQVIADAANYLRSQGVPNVDAKINTILKEGTAFEDLPSFVKGSKLGAKDLTTLMRRKEIAPEIRALLGEYKDPRMNFVKSATKMSRFIYNDRLLRDILDKGEGVFLFKEEDRPPDHFKKIAAPSSSVMEPLNGLYTTPEIEQAFKDAMDNEQLEGLYKTVVQLNGLVKYGKTVIAPTTAARNWMSAAFFTIANGHFNYGKAAKSLDLSRSYFTARGDQVEYLRRIKELGVVYDTPYAGEMIALLDDTILGERLIDKSGMKGFFDTATKAYQFGDDFWKIIGFENEVDLLMNAKEMTREQAEPIAAQRIRDTYPTYSLVGELPKKLRRFPLLGTFVSFPAEIIRTQANIIRYLKKDMDDPDMRQYVPRRVVGQAITSAGIYALQDMAFNSHDVSEEEEEAIRLMSPPWSKNSNILVTGRDDEGRIKYIDMTHLDPYAYFKRPLNAVLRDQPVDEAIYDASWEMLKPFLGYDISTKTILEFINNETEGGSRIYNPSDTLINKTENIYKHFEQGMLPSVIQNIRRTAKAYEGEVSRSGKDYVIEDEMAANVGFRITTFNPKRSLYYKAYQFNEEKREATSLLNNTVRDPNPISDGDLRTAFRNASRARKEAFERMSKIVQASINAGVSPTQAMVVLRANGVSKKDADALVKGGESAWMMSDSSLKNSLNKSDLLFGKKTSKAFKERFLLIQQLLEAENL